MPVLRLRKLKVREVSLVDKGAGKGVRVLLFKRRGEEPTETDGKRVELRIPITKMDVEKRQAFGWAYVSDFGDGPVVDFDKQTVFPEDLEAAAYDFLLESRKGGEMHERAKADDPRTTVQKSRCIESLVTTIEKQRALFNMPELADPVIPIGWWIGFQVDDEETWGRVKSGDLAEFSIAGSADAEEIETAKAKEKPMPVPTVTVMQKVRSFLGLEVKKDAGGYVPQTVGQILDGQEMRTKMWKLSDALMSSVSDITYASTIDTAKRIGLLKESVGQYIDRVEKCMGEMGEVEKRLCADTITMAETTIAALEANDDAGARACVEKSRKAITIDFEKAKSDATTTPTQENPMPTPTTTTTRTLEDILKALPDAERSLLVAALKAPPTTSTTTPAPDAVAEFMKSAPPELRAHFEKQEAATAALKKRVDDQEIEMAKARDTAELVACVEIAKGYKGLGVDVDQLGLTIKNLGRESEATKNLVKNLDIVVAKAAQAEKILTAELGHNNNGPLPGADSADAKATELAKKRMEDAEKAGKPITFEKARTLVFEENPKLLRATLKAAANAAKRAGGGMADDLPE